MHDLIRKNAISSATAEARSWARMFCGCPRRGDTTQDVTFGHCVIATGATARLLPGTEPGERVVTCAEQILSDKLPASVVIIGAGAIGIESPTSCTTSA